MPYRVPETRTPSKNNTFWRAFFRTLGGAGDVYVPFRPARYPQDAHYRNLVQVGKYLRNAMELCGDQIEKEEAPEVHPPESEPSVS